MMNAIIEHEKVVVELMISSNVSIFVSTETKINLKEMCRVISVNDIKAREFQYNQERNFRAHVTHG